MNRKVKTETGVVIIIIFAIIFGVIFFLNVKKETGDNIVMPNISTKVEAPSIPLGDAVNNIGENECSFPGYNWCGVQKGCIRTWDDGCDFKKTTNWKKYSNEKYGFEINYPGDFYRSSIDYTDIANLKKNNDTEANLVDPQKEMDHELFSVYFSADMLAGMGYKVFVYNTKIQDVDKYFNDEWKNAKQKMVEYEGTMVKPEIFKLENIYINGEKGKYIETSGFPFFKSEVSVNFIKNGYLYEISYPGDLTYEDNKLSDTEQKKLKTNYKKILKDIAITFKFTK